MSIQRLLDEAEAVVNRLRELDIVSNAVLVDAQQNQRVSEAIIRFKDELFLLNSSSSPIRNEMIISNVEESQTVRSELITENLELRACIGDYEKTMTYLMEKYRAHTSNTTLEDNVTIANGYTNGLKRIIEKQKEKIHEIASVMLHSASLDDPETVLDLEKLKLLEKENEKMRENLLTSKNNDYALQLKPYPCKVFDKCIQTDKPIKREAQEGSRKDFLKEETSGIETESVSSTERSELSDAEYFSTGLSDEDEDQEGAGDNDDEQSSITARFLGKKNTTEPSSIEEEICFEDVEEENASNNSSCCEENKESLEEEITSDDVNVDSYETA